MNFDNRVCQKLHEEHAAVIALLELMMQTIARHRNDVPDAKDPMVAKLMSDLAAELPGEVERHFAFEEAELFPYLSETGNQGIGAHLTYEHTIIPVSYTHLRAHETVLDLVCRLLLEKKNN